MLRFSQRLRLGRLNHTPVSRIIRRTMSDEKKPSTPLALPPNDPSGDGATKITVGSSVSMDSMGPIVVNTDGTISRIGNWAEMSEFERKNTLRIIGKRNQERRAALLAAQEKSASDSQSGDSSA